MISPNMIPQTCGVYRRVDDTTHSYVASSEQFVAEYACYLSMKRQPSQMQLDPQNQITCTMELLMNLPADIKSGDRVEIDDESFIVGYVYKPANRHIQADLSLEVEA